MTLLRLPTFESIKLHELIQVELAPPDFYYKIMYIYMYIIMPIITQIANNIHDFITFVIRQSNTYSVYNAVTVMMSL